MVYAPPTFPASASNTAFCDGATVVTPSLIASATFADVAASAYAVVAIRVLFVPAVCVGAVGFPVNAGDASGAFSLTSAAIRVASAEICDDNDIGYTSAASKVATKSASTAPISVVE